MRLPRGRGMRLSWEDYAHDHGWAPLAQRIFASAMRPVILFLAQSDLQFSRINPSDEPTSRWPYTFVQCRDRSDVLRELETDRGATFALIILDLAFNGEEGFAVLHWLTRLMKHVPVLVLCAAADDTNGLRAMELGAEDYLVDSALDSSVLNKSIQRILIRESLRQDCTDRQDQARVTLAAIGDAVIVTDLKDRITFANAAAMTLCKATAESDIIGKRFIDSVRITEAQSLNCLDPPAQAIAEGAVVRLPEGSLLTCLDGTSLDIEDSAAPIHDSIGRITGAVMVFRDVSATRAMIKQLDHLAHHDALTGLPNRRLFEDRLTQALDDAARNNRKLAVLYLDVDRFKEINSSFGHAAGDTILISVGQRLARSIRGTDTLCRHGGDEFIALMPSFTRVVDATSIARNLLLKIAEPCYVGADSVHVSASIGIALYPDDGADAPTLLRRADGALSLAKASGRNNFQFYQPENNVHAKEDRLIEQSLQDALEKDEFELHYQPIFRLDNQQMVRAEALLRWHHPTLGDIPPDRFIPIAEQSGHIVRIGRWVLNEVLGTLKRLCLSGNDIVPLAINISAFELRSEQFVDRLARALDAAQLPGHLLELELTETALIHDDRRTIQMLQSLRSLGIQCALDDFGLGFSGLNYLRRFPIDSLKIDKSFISGLTASGSDSHIVRAIVGLAASFNLKVVAEGIETDEQLFALNSLKCAEGQGFLMCRPIGREELMGRLSSPSALH